MAARGTKEPPLPPELQVRLDSLLSQPSSAADDDGEASSHLASLLSEWKALGNDCYSRGCFLAAVRCYTKHMSLPGGDTAALRSNRSAAYLQSSMHAGASLALKDAERAAEMEPRWFKAHVRVGDAQRSRGNVVEADAAYRTALELQPGCASAAAGLRALEAMVQEADGLPCPSSSSTPSSSPPPGRQQEAAPPVSRGGQLPTASAAAAAARGTVDREAPITQEQRIEGWKRETAVREDRTGMRPRPVSLAEADRQQGSAIKQSLLASFRAKAQSDEGLSATLRARREEELLQGEGVDYRNAEPYRRLYAHSTNGIGLGISADAYKEYTGQVDHRTW